MIVAGNTFVQKNRHCERTLNKHIAKTESDYTGLKKRQR